MEELPTLQDHPLHFKPMAVDTEVCPARQDAPIHVPRDLMPNVAPRARASVAVFRDTGSEWVPEGYQRSPWAVIRLKQRELLMDAIFLRNVTVTNYVELVGGVAKSFNALGTTTEFDNVTATQVLRWGTNNTAATNADFRLNSEADSFAPVSIQFDQTTFLNTFSGSQIYTGSAVNLQELGLSSQLHDTAQANFQMLYDRTVVSPVAVATNRTVAIEYNWQF